MIKLLARGHAYYGAEILLVGARGVMTYGNADSRTIREQRAGIRFVFKVRP